MKPTPIAYANFKEVTDKPEVLAKLEVIRGLVAEICPDAIVKQRNEQALIFMPLPLFNFKTNKNLVTAWLNGSYMQIKPDEPHAFDPAKLVEYRRRLATLLPILFDRNKVAVPRPQ